MSLSTNFAGIACTIFLALDHITTICKTRVNVPVQRISNIRWTRIFTEFHKLEQVIVFLYYLRAVPTQTVHRFLNLFGFMKDVSSAEYSETQLQVTAENVECMLPCMDDNTLQLYDVKCCIKDSRLIVLAMIRGLASYSCHMRMHVVVNICRPNDGIPQSCFCMGCRQQMVFNI